MTAIKLIHQSIDYKLHVVEAAVKSEHIVKIVPRFYQLDGEGNRHVARVERLTDELIAQGYRRYFAVYDVLGNVYDSLHATEEGQRKLEELYESAV